MLKALVEASLRRRGVVIALLCLAMGYELITIANAKLDVLPELARPNVLIRTEAPGFPPEEVETLVTRRVEQSLNGTEGLQSIRSRSIQGLSVVTAEFREGAGVPGVRQRVSEGLARIARDLPAGVESPVLAPLASSTGLVLGIGLTSEERSLMDVRTLAHWTIVPRLLAVTGVAAVAELGGEVRQIQVQMRPEALARHGLFPSQVVEATRSAIGRREAGFLETANQRIPFRIEGLSITAEELGECLAAPGIRLKDVARVADAPAPRIGDAAINGEPGVLLLVGGQHGQSSLDLTASLDAVLEEMRPLLEREGVRLHPDLLRPAGIMEASIPALALSLLAGGGLMALVLAVFFLDVRAALISLLAILLPLLTAAAILSASGASLNAFALGGLALALGGVADDAIIDVENILRRLRENRRRGSPRSALDVVLSASIEIRGAVVLAGLVAAVVFLPVITAPGIQGMLFAPLGVAYILAVLASMVVALAVTPALCLVLCARGPDGEEPAHVRRLKSVHLHLLGALARRPGGVIAALGALAALAAASVPFLGTKLLPDFREDHLVVRMSMAPGTSAIESMRLGCKVSKELLGHPLVRSAAMRVGRAEIGEDAAGTEHAELILALKGEEDTGGVRGDVRRMLAAVPGARFAVKSFLEERIEETVPGTRAEVTVRLFGDDLDVLDVTAGEVEKVLASIPGAAGVQSLHAQEPRLLIRLRKEKLKHLGFQPLEVLDAVRTSFQGTLAAQVHDQNRVFDVVVILDEKNREDPEGVGSLLLRNAAGAGVPLREVADVFLSTGRHYVLREGSRRYQEVSLNVEARDSRSFVREAKSRIASEVKLPPGVHAVFTGSAEASVRDRREVLVHSALAAAGILLLLALALKSPPNLLCLLAGLPFALSGGVLAVLLTGGWLSPGSLAGFVAIFGITTRNAIMIISRSEHLVLVEGRPWNLETALQGASERLVPVLMTACVTVLGLLPLALDSGQVGGGIHGPMAVVIFGGLVTSTLLSLLVLPSLLLRHGKFGDRAA